MAHVAEMGVCLHTLLRGAGITIGPGRAVSLAPRLSELNGLTHLYLDGAFYGRGNAAHSAVSTAQPYMPREIVLYITD